MFLRFALKLKILEFVAKSLFVLLFWFAYVVRVVVLMDAVSLRALSWVGGHFSLVFAVAGAFFVRFRC